MALLLNRELETDFRSRAVDDQEEESAPVCYFKPVVKLSSCGRKLLEKLGTEHFQPESLYIATDVVSSKWVKRSLGGKYEIYGTIIQPEGIIRGHTVGSTVEDSCAIVSANGGETMFIMFSYPRLESPREWDFVFSAFSIIKAQRVTAFGTMFRQPFEGSHELGMERPPNGDIEVQRILTTSAKRVEESSTPGNESRIPFLKAPMIVTGLMAAVISYCEMQRMEAAGYIALYSSSFLPEELLVRTMTQHPCLRQLSADYGADVISACTEVPSSSWVKNQYAKSTIPSTLYM